MKINQLMMLLLISILLSSCSDKPETSEKSETTEPKILASLNQLHDAIKTLAKQPVQQSSQVSSAHHVPEELIIQAEQLLEKGQLTTANLYFSHALAQNPGHWPWIQRYQHNLLTYVHELSKQGQFKQALTLLDDIKAFLHTQVLYVNTRDLDKLEQNLAEIAQLQQQLQAQQRQNINQHFEQLLGDKQALLATPTTSINSQELEVLHEQLVHFQLNNSLEPAQQQKITALEDNINVISLIQQIQQFIEQALTASQNHTLSLYYLSSAETLIQQLVLVAVEQEPVKKQIISLSQQLQQAQKKLLQRQAQAVWQSLKSHCEAVKLNKELKAQENIEQLLQVRQLIAQKMTQLSPIIKTVKTCLTKIEQHLENAQNMQTKFYNLWAIGKIQDFYQKNYKEVGIMGDEDKIYHNLIEHLGSIDLRYLSMPTQTAYSEVFSKFYGELDDEQKISLTTRMTLTEKKPLTDF